MVSLMLESMGLKLLRMHVADNWHFIMFSGIKLDNKQQEEKNKRIPKNYMTMWPHKPAAKLTSVS